MAGTGMFFGFGDGTGAELATITGSVQFVTAPAPPHPSETYVAKLQAGGQEIISPGFSSTHNDYGPAFWIRFDQMNPNPDFAFFHAEDGKGAEHFSLYLKNTGRLQATDANGAIIGTSGNNVFLPNQWHLVRIYWEKSDAGTFRVDVDGVTIFDCSSEDVNATTAGSPDIEFRFSTQGPGAASPCTVYVNSCSCRWDCSSWADHLADFEVLGPYQKHIESATPDVGDDLDAGYWSDAAEIPFDSASYGRYSDAEDIGVVTTSTTAGGKIPGPYGDDRIKGDDRIMAGSWCVTWFASSFLGGNTFLFRYGDTPYNEVTVDNTTQIDLGSVMAGVQHDLIVSDAAADVPDTGEYFQYGFEAAAGFGGRSVTLYDCACFILHEIRARGMTLGCGYASRARDIMVG